MLNHFQKIYTDKSFLLKGVIDGHLPSGKNKYRLSGQRWFKAKELVLYENYALIQLASLVRKSPIQNQLPLKFDSKKENEHLGLAVEIYFQNYRRDVDSILFCDVLQKAGIVENDRAIRWKFIFGLVDAKNPRIEFGIFYIKDFLQ